MSNPFRSFAPQASGQDYSRNHRGRMRLAVLALWLATVPVWADITNGLVAYYDFEGLAGTVGETVVDRSGQGHDGVCRQDQSTLRAPTLVAGLTGLGQALNFDGSFYVQIPNHSDFDLTTNITVAAWVSIDTFDQDYQTVICRGDWSWRLHRRSTTDYITFGMSGLSGGNGANDLSTNVRLPKRWVHLVATYTNGTGAALYINGALATNSLVSGLIATNGSDPVTIGAQINAGTLRRQWKGQIDEVRLYNRALRAADAAELYSFALPSANSQPTVNVPAAINLNAPTNVQMTATVTDDGSPLPANPASPDPNDPNKLRWGWSVVSVPASSAGVVWSGNPTNGEAFTYRGSPNPPGTVFTNNPAATFDVPGLYVLQFTASDGQMTVSNTVNVLVAAGSMGPDITNGLVAYYDFENLTGAVGETVADRSGHGHDGVCRQDQSTLRATVVAGSIGLGDALNLDGNFYVQIPNHADFNLTTNLTIAAWVSVDVFDQAWQAIFCRGDWSWRLSRRNSTDNASFNLSGLTGGVGPDGTTTNIRLPKRWVHLVGTYTNGGGASLYINGSVEMTAAVSGQISTSGSDPVTIGAQINSGILGRQWKGQLDEVRLYNRALSPNDVTALYNLVLTNVNGRPTVTVPANISLNTPTNIQLTATVLDDGNPLPANPSSPDTNDANKLRWSWSVVSVPASSAGVAWTGNPTNGEAFTYQGSPNPPGTVFTNNPTAGFDVPGLYVVQFSASDGQRTVSNTVSVLVNSLTNDYRALGYSYLSPVPNAPYCSPQTRFLLVRLKGVSPASITNLSQFVQVTGSVSGSHSGPTHIATDGRTVIFQNNINFTANEVVTVSLAPGVPPQAGGPIAPYQYQFAVSTYMPGTPASPSVVSIPASQLSQGPVASGTKPAANPALAAMASTMPNGVSVPSELPLINITVNDNPCPDPIFIDNRGGGGKNYNIIFDNNGSPLWYQKMPDERRDMKVQTNGVLTMLARNGGLHFNGFDTNYHQVASYYATNGYTVDEHELQVRPDGSYFMVALRGNTVDMSRYVTGGNTAASVTEMVIQEFTAAGELVFQFRAWDNFDPRDEAAFINIKGGSFDFTHMNAIDVDTDGNMLLSSRNTSEVTKINLETGEILWRLGGVHNQFTYLNDPLNGPANQHSIRMVGTNHYILFDNGNLHTPSMSRGVEYELDPTSMTARIVWQYPSTATNTIYSYYMGNIQRLSNGNTLINWAVGGLPKLTEVRPDGTKAFEMNWVNGYEAYRTWRCPWQGVATEPYLMTESYPDNLTLIFNQFGDTNVAFYRIYGGTTAHPTNLLATSGATLKQLNNLQNGTWYFRVTSVNRQGVESGYSNEQTATVNIIKPGQNLVNNGDFSQGTSSWVWTMSGGASASWNIQSGVSYIAITNGGSALSSVQLKQTGKALIQGKKYVFEFDAWASSTRTIEAKVAQDALPNLNYSGTSSTTLTVARNHYRYVFTMTAATDLNASVFFNLGVSTRSVYLDNVSLFAVPTGDINMDGRVDLLDLQLSTQDWLKQAAGLGGDLNTNHKVDFGDFSILGDNWSSGN